MTSFLLIAAVVMWGLSFIATKYCLRFLSPAEIIAARFVLAVPVLLIVVRVKRLSFELIRRQWMTAVACALVLVFHLLIQVEGMKTTTATNTAWLITTIPVFIVILSYFFLREKITGYQALGMAIAAFGVVLLVSRGRLGSLEFIQSYGDWLVLISAVTWSVYTILGKKLAGSHPLAVTTSVLTIAAVCLVPPVLMTSGVREYAALDWTALGALVFLGVFCMGLAYWFWAEGLKRKTAGGVGVYLYLEPISTTLAAPFLLNEPVTPALLGGAALVVAGVWLVERHGSWAKK